jgi:hypothetical protein
MFKNDNNFETCLKNTKIQAACVVKDFKELQLEEIQSTEMFKSFEEA